jgi:hypothetical protein
VLAFLFSVISLVGLAYVLVAVFWCALTKSPLMAEVYWIPSWLGKWADAYPVFRNFPAFALFSFISSLVLSSSKSIQRTVPPLTIVIISWLGVSVLGVGLEFAQLWIPTRSFDLSDIAWTLAGAFTGAFLALLPLLLAFQKPGDD